MDSGQWTYMAIPSKKYELKNCQQICLLALLRDEIFSLCSPFQFFFGLMSKYEIWKVRGQCRLFLTPCGSVAVCFGCIKHIVGGFFQSSSHETMFHGKQELRCPEGNSRRPSSFRGMRQERSQFRRLQPRFRGTWNMSLTLR